MRSEADDGRPETSPDTGARRNSPNKDSSSKKLSNTPLPIHDARDPVSGHGLRLGQTVLDVVARSGDRRLPVVASAAAASPLDLYSLIQFLAVYAGMASRLASASLPAPALMSASASRRNPSS